MQQRIALAQALMNDPDLVVLDEPTDGLDPVGRKETREVLERLRAQGKTVFINSHLLGEVERICDRVAIIVSGKVVRQGTINELTAGSTATLSSLAAMISAACRTRFEPRLPCQLTATAPRDGLSATSPQAEPLETGQLPSGETVELAGRTLQIATDDALRIQPLLDALRAKNLVIQAVRPVRQSLEDYFMQAVSAAPRVDTRRPVIVTSLAPVAGEDGDSPTAAKAKESGSDPNRGDLP